MIDSAARFQVIHGSKVTGLIRESFEASPTVKLNRRSDSGTSREANRWTMRLDLSLEAMEPAVDLAEGSLTSQLVKLLDLARQFVHPGTRDERVAQGMMDLDCQSPTRLGNSLGIQLLELGDLH
jgi:hypothetical protein